MKPNGLCREIAALFFLFVGFYDFNNVDSRSRERQEMQGNRAMTKRKSDQGPAAPGICAHTVCALTIRPSGRPRSSN